MEPSSRTARPTIRDVAAAAGVSRGTVSRVINGGHWVSPEARRLVEDAIAETGYTVNQHARSLATGRANSLAFLVTEPQHLLFEDPTYSLLLRGATQALAERGMTLVLLMAGTEGERRTTLEYLRAGHVDGVLLISSHASDLYIGELAEAGVPAVCSGLPAGPAAGAPAVSIDEDAATRAMVRHLRGRGRQRIAHLAGPADTPGGRLRHEAFQDELGEGYDARLVEAGDFGRASGAAAMERLLAGGADFDAVFAASDAMAAGAVSVLRREGLRVPDDVGVAGFDDSGLAEAHDPPLTTIRQPWEEISREMVALLLEAVNGAPARQVMLPTTLVQRAST
ncbi:LacI family DNA-binding transcriptional regulator [Zhihengliuella halotolerans]|nr:LacI family DNA-binding transcriptional regulator [Zhihengliuella halotolerans]